MFNVATHKNHMTPAHTCREKLIDKKSHKDIMVLTGYTNDDYDNDQKYLYSKKKLYIFWMIIILLIILVIGNLLTTVILLGVLKISTGMASLEFIPAHNYLKFFGDIDLDKVINIPGIIEGFMDEPILFESEDSGIMFQIHDPASTKFTVEPNHIHVANVQDFKIIDPNTGDSVFYTSAPQFGLPNGIKHLEIQKSLTERIESPLQGALLLRSDTRSVIKGNEGTHLLGEEILFKANQDVYLKAMNGSINMSNAKESGDIYIDTSHMDLVGEEFKFGSPQNKICVCGHSGHIFLLSANHGTNCDQLPNPPCREE